MNNLNIIDNTNGEDLVEIENKYWADLYHALERLHDNKDFQDVILNAYFKDRAVNGVSMLANRGVIQGGKRGEIMEELVAVSHLQDFFITIAALGRPATEEELAELEE